MTAWYETTVAYWQAAGPLLVPLALVCFGIWASFFRSRDALARAIYDSRELEALLRTDVSGDAVRIERVLSEANNRLATVFQRALHDIMRGARPMEVLSATEEECSQSLGRDLIVMAALTAVAPLLGLLGTVTGMIETFDAVSVASGSTGTRVAGGVSQALVTTQFGLVVALPGVFGIARLRRMLQRARVGIAACRVRTVTLLEAGT